LINRSRIAFVCLALSLNVVAQATRPQDSIKPEALRAHVQFLSDDLLEGRGTGTRGHEIAARYVASQFQGMGLKGAGDNGSCFQAVHLRQAIFKPEQSSFSIAMKGKEEAQKLESDWYTEGNYLQKDSSLEGQVIFVGMGITAPELKHDDYANIDVKGKIVAMISGAPAAWESTTRAYYSSGYLKAENAAKHGAIGVMALWSADIDQRFSWAQLLRNVKFPAFNALDKNGRPIDTYEEIKGSVLVSVPKSKELLASANIDLDGVEKEALAGKYVSAELPITAKVHIVTEHREITSPNVIAVVPGSDPKLKDEYVVYSAHLDHIGISEPDKGDSINNGAYDNASGSAVLMEIARAFSKMPKAPKRSVLFINVTGEEKGLLGAYYFSLNPTVPVKNIVADINLDEIAALYPLKDIVAWGAEHSTMNNDVIAASKEVGFEISPDPFPAEAIFIRSDQFPFVRQGIPAVYIGSGMNSSDPKVDGKAIYMNWLQNIYHTPHDEITLPFDWNSNVKLAKLNFIIGNRIANAPSRPTWNKGDVFQQKFGGPVGR
jgi:hypothetical protein